MTNDSKPLRSFHLRIPKDTWLFLRKQAAAQEITMTEIILRCVDKYKKKFDNKLKSDD